MKRRTWLITGIGALLAFAVLFMKGLALPEPPAGIVIEQLEVPDTGHAALPVLVWHSRNNTGSRWPLIVISHGAGGSRTDHAETAAALAQAGFVVAAVEHTGDNYRDTSGVSGLTAMADRPRHIVRTLDFLTGKWNGRARIDPDRIGMFGFSAGGFTALVLSGATPDLSRGTLYCHENPSAWTCRYLRKNGVDPDRLAEGKQVKWLHDPRIKGAALAAPALGYSFAADSARHVSVPLVVWSAQDDEVVEDSPARILGILSPQVERTVVSHAGHFSFMTPCNWQKRILIGAMHLAGRAEDICTDSPDFDREAFHADFNKAIISFFVRQLGPIANTD